MKKLVYYFFLLFFILTHGCKPDDISPKSNTDPSEQIGRTTSALLGEVTFEDDCSPEHQAFNDSIMMFARIAVATDAFEECLREKVTDLYQKCNGDPFYNENVNVQI